MGIFAKFESLKRKYLKIAVNTRLLLKDKLEGIGWFSYEILKRLTQNHPEHQFLFIFDRPYDSSFVFADNVEAIVVGPQARHPFLYLIWFEFSIPRILKKHQVDLFLSPDSYLSLSTSIPSVTVIHDLNFEYYPKDLLFFARMYNKTMFPRFARKAKRVISVSEYSKQDIHKLYGIPKEQIDVVYNAANERFKALDFTEIEDVRKEYSGGIPYFVYVGALNPRKNLVNLLKAFDQLCEKEGAKAKMIVVGNKMYRTQAIDDTYKNMKFKEQVVFLGHLKTEDLNRIYGAALALAYVSYFEGFGIPIVEAFRSHCPVITSNVTSMPEVAGDAALLVDPFSVDEISSALSRILNEDDLRKQLIEKGCQQVKKFSWDISAEKMWESLVKITGPSTGSGSLET
jgi:glycosyltransferase involved in cell wall biosynthesis